METRNITANVRTLRGSGLLHHMEGGENGT